MIAYTNTLFVIFFLASSVDLEAVCRDINATNELGHLSLNAYVQMLDRSSLCLQHAESGQPHLPTIWNNDAIPWTPQPGWLEAWLSRAVKNRPIPAKTADALTEHLGARYRWLWLQTQAIEQGLALGPALAHNWPTLLQRLENTEAIAFTLEQDASGHLESTNSQPLLHRFGSTLLEHASLWVGAFCIGLAGFGFGYICKPKLST